MFQEAKYTKNSFSIIFPKQPDIRRKANEFEDLLKGLHQGDYGQPPLVISIPDELDPEVPRLIFGSRRGYSQIIISQVNMTLNVAYSPDWQIDISKGRQYFLERAKVLFELLKIFGETVKPYYSGITTHVYVPSIKEDKEIIECISQKFFKQVNLERAYDIQIKITTIHSDKFFSRTTIQNQRIWKPIDTQKGMPRLSIKNSAERGILIINDFNDRYSYNENNDYFSTLDVAKEIINLALDEIKQKVSEIGEESDEILR